jgi:hypothetical protein
MVSTYHCAKLSVTHGEWTFWSEEWAKGDKLGTLGANVMAKPVSTGSIAEAILDAVCTY